MSTTCVRSSTYKSASTNTGFAAKITLQEKIVLSSFQDTFTYSEHDNSRYQSVESPAQATRNGLSAHEMRGAGPNGPTRNASCATAPHELPPFRRSTYARDSCSHRYGSRAAPRLARDHEGSVPGAGPIGARASRELPPGRGLLSPRHGRRLDQRYSQLSAFLRRSPLDRCQRACGAARRLERDSSRSGNRLRDSRPR